MSLTEKALTSFLSPTHSCALTAAYACVSPSGRVAEENTVQATNCRRSWNFDQRIRLFQKQNSTIEHRAAAQKFPAK
jgi:hypothetical protein